MMNYDTIRQKLQSALSPKRYKHTLGVVQVSQELGSIYGMDKEKIFLSALLHDCAKDMPVNTKARLCKEYHIPLDSFMRDDIELCHSFLGAEIAKREYNILDREILDAIRYHTTGRAHMTKLEKIIYLADYIEPNRENFEGLETVRRLSYENLDKAVIFALINTIEYIKNNKKTLHPLTLQALDYLTSKKEEKN
ncbi:MAG: HD domain-containing protein [Epulopiscium sp.]|nr:HD domain-containing protein [Candidatus Epulonipiscium sp.]